MMKVIMVCTFLACLFVVASTTEVKLFQECGHQLSELLSSVCGAEYYEPDERSLRKRSIREYRPAAGSVSNWIMSRPRLSRGVVDECCKQACTEDVLQAYCAYTP